MSGTGTNAEKVLEKRIEDQWNPAVIVTDAPEKSRAAEIAERFGLPLAALDIKEFYRSHGESRVSLMTENGRRVRELWTDELRRIIAHYEVDFGILAGFVPLSNITSDFPCLNVHPGDLTVQENGQRLLVGLHKLPVEKALLNGFETLRSSVIVAQAYTGKGGEMDSGPVLGISEAMPVDLLEVSLEDLKNAAESRPAKRPAGGFKDVLDKVAAYNLERLKERGDWNVLPGVVNDFAAGLFRTDSTGQLFVNSGDKWIKIRTIEYGETGKKLVHA
jgi:folate-dependent phosphoribosylglycinamide formyltransferase PurN